MLLLIPSTVKIKISKLKMVDFGHGDAKELAKCLRYLKI